MARRSHPAALRIFEAVHAWLRSVRLPVRFGHESFLVTTDHAAVEITYDPYRDALVVHGMWPKEATVDTLERLTNFVDFWNVNRIQPIGYMLTGEDASLGVGCVVHLPDASQCSAEELGDAVDHYLAMVDIFFIEMEHFLPDVCGTTVDHHPYMLRLPTMPIIESPPR
ncbi:MULTISPECIES: hypothetical protein [Corynebacterium]|uniref:hypothetical protein n=1 Tax=Corynebacterium TaxID=1716 RepID=UPI00124E5D70|nr:MULTISPECIES: hypothetical protein [Corynebacterium]MBV7280984.1 hypothetical protein [Corynebacterium sp. TAE3-ERU30]MBV7302706.1 hypothetical protein [Corynebacterium sp. TAE3-ERU2]